MLSYRHAFHAGNHADILKHVILQECLQYMTHKEKPVLYVDTHAGAGAYRLGEGYSGLNNEWESGLGRLLNFSEGREAPAAVSEYIRLALNRARVSLAGEYPGSPALAARILRPQDRLALCELHTTDHAELARRFEKDSRAQVYKDNGFSILKSLLPPLSRRGLVFMDPSYEIPADYDSAVESMTDSLRRFATGTYLIWYPLLERPEARSLPDRLLAITDRPRLNLSLRVLSPPTGEYGLAGSGMVIFNPPWTLETTLKETLPYLTQALGEDSAKEWRLEIPEKEKADEGSLPCRRPD